MRWDPFADVGSHPGGSHRCASTRRTAWPRGPGPRAPSRRGPATVGRRDRTDRQSFFDSGLRCLGGAVGLAILSVAPVRSMFPVVPRLPCSEQAGTAISVFTNSVPSPASRPQCEQDTSTHLRVCGPMAASRRWSYHSDVQPVVVDVAWERGHFGSSVSQRQASLVPRHVGDLGRQHLPTRLSMLLSPPSARAMTWSAVDAGRPQYKHAGPPARMSFRCFRYVWL